MGFKVDEEEYQKLIDLGYLLLEEINGGLDNEKELLKKSIYKRLLDKSFRFTISDYNLFKSGYISFEQFLKSFNYIKSLLEEIKMYSQMKRQIIANTFIIPDTKGFNERVEQMKQQKFSDSTIIEQMSKEYQLPKQAILLKLMELRLSLTAYGRIIEPTLQNGKKR